MAENITYKSLIEKAKEEHQKAQYKEEIKLYRIAQIMFGKTLSNADLISLNILFANAYYCLKDLDKYTYYYEEYLKLYPQGQASVFSRLAHAYYFIDADKSIDYHNKCLNIELNKYDVACKLFAMTKSSFYEQLDLKETSEQEIETLKTALYSDVKKYNHDDKKAQGVNKKLNIGYLSSDCFCHTMMNYILPIWQCHNQEKFNFFIFSCAEKEDVKTDEIKATGIEFIKCNNKSDSDLAKAIKEKDIDILIDLGGYTHLKSFVALYKPAPIIMSYLGYLNTLGMNEVDYIITDKYTIPEEYAYLYTEKPLYLDAGYQIFADKSLEDVTECPFEKNGYITYGSFNCTSKFSDATIYLWAQLLKADKTAKLLIYRTQLTLRIIKWVKEKLKKFDVDLDRVMFSSQNYSTHFKAYSLCDIALDPYPFSGMSIAIECALMGVPTNTLIGEGMQSRGAGRINHLLGLDELIANTGEQYVKNAVKLAQDKEKLKALRKDLRGMVNNSDLKVGAQEFTKDLEDKFTKAWIEFINTP